MIIDVALDSSWGPSIGSLVVPAGGDGKTISTYSCGIKNIKGIHSLWFRFKSDADETFCLDSFNFD